MEPQELELFSTKQLISELMRRRSFLGVIVHSEEEERGQEWSEVRMFKMHFNKNLDSTSAGRLLQTVAERINLDLC